MKKGLSIAAVAAGIFYLAAGISLLVFQNIIKTAMGYGHGVETVNVYPLHNVLQLVFMGAPCVVLGGLSMSDSTDNRRGIDMLLIIYSSVMLVLGGLLTAIGSTVNTFVVSRTMGIESTVSMSVISAAFTYIQFLINLSLVLLLLRGAFGLGDISQNRQ